MRRDNTPALIFIVGPTATGKTRLAVKLAKKIKGEVVSADSMQIYKGMAILSQAPSRPEMKNIRHYLVGSLDPQKEYSAASFIKTAVKIIKSIIKRKKIPVIAGGSGLYIKALIDGIFPSPEADIKFRKKTARFVAENGSKILHDRLSKIDPDSAASIHPNDARRIIRALELYHSTGRTMTELKNETRGLKDKYAIKIFGLNEGIREKLYSKIDSRVDEMFEDNVIGEVKRLREKKLSKTAGAVLGLKEIEGYLKGEYDLDTAKSFMKMNTRRFAKRQLTWFRADKRIKWFDIGKLSDEDIIRRILK